MSPSRSIYGPRIIERNFTVRKFGSSGYRGQYHSRSDRHSKVASWAVLFDLALESALLRAHATQEKIVFGVNHTMVDYNTDRKKDLDLVVATPGSNGKKQWRTLAQLVDEFDIVLDDEERARLGELPPIMEGPVGAVHMAVEAKAVMTAHIKALPRLYDELNSSQLTVHGAAEQAIAVGVVEVNLAERFLAYQANELGMNSEILKYNVHRQPDDATRTIQKLMELPRRTEVGGDHGFDALGLVCFKLANDGSPAELVTDAPAPAPTSMYHYGQMIRRIASQYSFRFQQV